MNTRLFTAAVLALSFSEFAYAKDLPKQYDGPEQDEVARERLPDLDEDAEEEIKDIEMTKHDLMDKSLRYFDGIRGMWIGFNRGLYRDTPRKEMEKECLNNEQRRRWEEAYSVWLGLEDQDDDVDMFSAMGDIL